MSQPLKFSHSLNSQTAHQLKTTFFFLFLPPSQTPNCLEKMNEVFWQVLRKNVGSQAWKRKKQNNNKKKTKDTNVYVVRNINMRNKRKTYIVNIFVLIFFFDLFQITFIKTTKYRYLNLFQKHLFLYQLTHNMTNSTGKSMSEALIFASTNPQYETADCSLNYQFSTWKLQA